MKKVLFVIHDLGHGGAEKVLVNLVNHLDHTQFDITVMALFGGGVNEQFLNTTKVRLINCHRRLFPGNSKVMKLFSSKCLYRHYIKEHYDIVVSYLEGPCARIVSGCQNPKTKLVSWIHVEQYTPKRAAAAFRSVEEAENCYNRFNRIICVSNTVKEDFLSCLDIQCSTQVMYNTNETAQILEKSIESVDSRIFSNGCFHWCGVGKIIPNKGFDRMIRIQKKLIEKGYHTHFYALGVGPQQVELEQWCKKNGVSNSVTFLGYQTNPYKYMAKCDLYVCASHAEGFSTAATEALIVGTPVCTVEVSGMKEMLGQNNEYGIVTENDESALYQGIKQLLDDSKLYHYYRGQAALRGKDFCTEKTVQAVETMLLELE